MIREFRADNVRYLELRTTPRASPSNGMTKRSHIATVVRAMNSAMDEHCGFIIVRLLLAIDRRTDVENAMDTVKMAVEFRDSSKGLVVGVDLSGDPEVLLTPLLGSGPGMVHLHPPHNSPTLGFSEPLGCPGVEINW